MLGLFRLGLLAISLTLFAVVGCDSSRSLAMDVAVDGARDAAVDAPAPRLDVSGSEMALGDATVDAVRADIDHSFPAILEGLWLIGWSGGLNHFSWVRLGKIGAGLQAKAWINAGKNITVNAPLLDCTGETTWSIGAAADTAYIKLPAPTCLPSAGGQVAWVFSNYGPPDALAPRALLGATVKEQATLSPLSGYKFPDDWCDATLTTCKSPF